MLRPFLFIGCGGSGVSTIRRVRRNLITAMEFQGLSASDFPDAWQFLAIDIPTVEDSGAALQAYADNDYIGLDNGISYSGANGIDEQLSRKPRTQADFATWRPNPEPCIVDVGGAQGQFRAVGRAAAGLALDTKLQPAIDDKTARMQSRRALAELHALEEVFLEYPHGEGNRPAPMVFIVSSLGGGAGSGIFMDVAEAVRRSSDGQNLWLQHPIGILFDPTVFSHHPNFLASGIPANTLAAVSEIVCGKWNEGERSVYLPSRVGHQGAGRGPQHTFIFGRTNGAVTLETQDDAYDVAASLLSNLVLRPEHLWHFEHQIHTWGPESATSGALPIHDNAEIWSKKPLSAIGYGNISLGRDRFRLYASERITRGALKLATQIPTLEGADPERVASFLDKCQLNEGTPERDQVLIGLLDPTSINYPNDAKASDALVAKFIAEPVATAKERIIQFVTKPVVTPRKRILPRVTNPNAVWDHFLARERIDGDVARAEIFAALQVNLLEWAAAIQVKVLDVVCEMAAQDGLLLTRAVVASAVENEIARDFPAELRAEAATGLENLNGTLEELAKTIKATRMGRGPIPWPVRKLLGTATEQLLSWNTYIAIRELAARTLEGMAKDLFTPILAALDVAIEMARFETESDAFNNLSDKDPRPTLRPAPNELLLLDVDNYTATFDALVENLDAGEHRALVDCLRGAIGDGIGYGLPTTELSKQSSTAALRPWQVVAGAAWIPEQRYATGGVAEQETTAKIEFRFGMKDVQARANAWLVRDTRPAGFAPMLHETLGEWLNQSTADEQLTRANQVAKRLADLFQIARPMTSLNKAWMLGELAHNGELAYGLSGIPLDANNNRASWETVNTVVATHLPNAAAQNRAYNAKARGAIELVAFLSPTVPSAFNSLTEPIVGSFRAHQMGGAQMRENFWRGRRARPLEEFIPLPRTSQLTIARGWIIGHLLGAININGTGMTAVATLNLADQKYAYLHNLLDEGSKDYLFIWPSVGPMDVPVGWERTEWFGMILESSLLAEMLAVHDDREPLRALTALLSIGRAHGQAGPTTDYMIPGISIAQATLESLAGVPAILQSQGETASGDLVIDRDRALEIMAKNYASMVQEPMIAWRNTPRATQVNETLMKAANQIQAALG